MKITVISGVILSYSRVAAVYHLSTTVTCCDISRLFNQYLCDEASKFVCSLLPIFSYQPLL